MMDYQIKFFEEYEEAYCKSVEDPEGFWGEVAGEFRWRKIWDKVLEWNFEEPDVIWFKGGRLNITENCIDRHLEIMGNTLAILRAPNTHQKHSKNITSKALQSH